MTLGRLMMAVMFLAVATGLLVWNTRKGDPARHVQNLSYPVRCLHCGNKGVLTIAAMNAMVRRGDVVSPPEQMRRFKCASCGETQVVLDAGGRNETVLTKR